MSFSGALPPTRLNLAQYCLGSERTDPDKIAVVVETGATRRRVSYGELITRVQCLAGGFLSLGLSPGARVFLRMGNSLDYAIAFFAANAAGLVPIPASSQLTETEAAFLIEDSNAAVVISDGTLALNALPNGCTLIDPDRLASLASHEAHAFADTASEDPGYMVYTSGTSGAPKGVLHAQRAVWGRRPMFAGWTGIGAADRVLHTGAFNWTYTLGVGLFDPLAVGATAIIYTGLRDDAVWSQLAREEGASMLASVPGLFRSLLRADALPRNPEFRHALTAGEAIAPATAQAWEDVTGKPIYEALGMSELSTFISSGPACPRLPGRSGKAQPGRDVRIIPIDGGTEALAPGEAGLIAAHCSDPGLMLRYWNRPEDSFTIRRGEWFIGGDLGEMDEAGYIRHLGRHDDVMNAMGYRVSPAEVEDVLARVPGVAEVAVTDVAVSAEARQIAAFIIPGHPGPSRAALEATSALYLAPYKRPRLWHMVKSLPRTANGKVMRRKLRESSNQNRNDT